MNIERINSAARDIIRRNDYRADARPTRAQIDAAVLKYCDNPSTTRIDMLRIRTRIEFTLDGDD